MRRILQKMAICILLSWAQYAISQNVSVNNTGAAPAATAVLDVAATNKGLLIPRLSATQRNSIASPAAGLFIFDVTTNKLEYWNGSAWIQLSNNTVVATNSAGTNTGTGVSISGTLSAADQSAMLDVQSSTGGLLIPRLTATQIGNITSPVVGLIVYNTSTNMLNFNTSSGWAQVCGSSVSTTTGAVTTIANAGIGTTSPNTSAMLDITSTTAGLAIPRLTSAQRNAILSPAQGLMLFNTTTQAIEVYDGTANWLQFVSEIIPAPAGAISGSSTVCTNESGVTYSVGAITGATGYVWTYTGTGFSIASGANTNSITVNFSSATAGTLTVYGTSACGSGTISAAYPIGVFTAVPSGVTASAAANPICIGSTLSLTGEATNASTWSWTGPNSYASSSQSPSISSITSAGGGTYYTLTASNACGSAATVNTASVTVVTSVPTSVTATPSASFICTAATPNQNMVLTGTGTSPTPITWSWTGPNSYTATSQSPTITNIPQADSGVYTLTATNVCGGASASTPSIAINNIIDARDGQRYSTILIGTQCWMAQNLNYGTWIPTTGASVLATLSGNTMTVTSVTSGTLSVGEYITGIGVPNPYTTITALGTGTGGTGTYTTSATMTTETTPVTITASGSEYPAGTQKFCTNVTGTGDNSACPYGGLYMWSELMDGVNVSNTNAHSCDGVYATGTFSGTTMNVTSVATGGGFLVIGDSIQGAGVTQGTTVTGYTSATASSCYCDAQENLWIGGTISGTFSVGQYLTGTGVPATLKISSQTSGTAGGAGEYTTPTNTTVLGSGAVTVATSTTNLLDVTTVTTGVVSPGLIIYEPVGSFPANETITAYGTGTSTASSISGTTLIIGGTTTGYYGVGSPITGTGVTAGTTITAVKNNTSTASHITGTTLTIGGTLAGYYGAGQILTGGGVTANTVILGQVSGTPGGAGVYEVSISQTIGAGSVHAAISSTTTLTVNSVISGVIAAGDTISGTGVPAGTYVVSQLTGTAGGIGTYTVSNTLLITTNNTVVTVYGDVATAINSTNAIVTNTATSGSISGTTLTIGGTITGVFAVGQMLSGSGVTAGTTITALGTGTGGAGTYTVSTSQTEGAATVTANLSGSQMTVTSVTSGTLGVGATIAGTGITGGTTISSFGTNSAEPCKIVGTTLTIGVGSLSGYYGVGQPLVGPGVTPGTIITGQLTGTPGGVGTYSVNISQTSGTNEYINSTSVGGVGNYNASASMTTGTGVTVTSTQPIYSNSGGGVGSYTVSTSQTTPASGTEAINTAATGGTGIYIVSVPLVAAGPSQTMTVYDGAPIAISTAPGGAGTYTVSTTVPTGSSTITNYRFPECVANIQGACPAGWHVPSHTEWTYLERSVLHTTDSTDFFYDEASMGTLGTTEGAALKQIGTTNWTSSTGNAGTNTTGFTALPGGISGSGTSFAAQGSSGYFYTSTGGANSWMRILQYNSTGVERVEATGYLSARCVKN